MTREARMIEMGGAGIKVLQPFDHDDEDRTTDNFGRRPCEYIDDEEMPTPGTIKKFGTKNILPGAPGDIC